MNELKEIKVKIVSLVGKAANGFVVICKCRDADTKKGNTEINFNIKKSDELKKKIYGIVYTPNKEDSQGDYATAETIEKASDSFMIQLNGTNKIDTEHNLIIEPGLNIVENWIVRKGDELFPTETGAWAIGVKVKDDEIWNKIQKGELTGFSMYGEAVRVVKENTEEKLNSIKDSLSKVLNLFKSKNMEDTKEIKLLKDFNSLSDESDIFKYLYVLGDAFDSIFDDETITDKKAAIAESIDQFKAKVTAVNVAKGIAGEAMTDGKVDVEKAGKVLSGDNLTKLQTAIDAINSIITAAAAPEGGDVKKSKENDMAAEIKKAVVEATAAIEAELKKSKEETEAVRKEFEDFKLKSPGSGQEIDTAEVKKEEGKIFKWV